jgi:hypothetical protein
MRALLVQQLPYSPLIPFAGRVSFITFRLSKNHTFWKKL